MNIFRPTVTKPNTSTLTNKSSDSIHKSSNSTENGGSNVGNPLLNLPETQLRDLCRHHVDTFENWSRRLLDETLRNHYGANYFDHMVSDKQPLVKGEIKRRIEQRMADNPGRFPRKIDAILMEDIEYFLCRDDLYDKHFKSVLEPFFSGIAEVRKVLGRLIPIRNKLSHGNTISLHEAEQCICYTGDFVAVYKQHYAVLGKDKEYNVPIILRIKDSLGHDFIRESSQGQWEMHCYGYRTPKVALRSGDEYKLWIEVDSSFDSSFYDIRWIVKQDYTTLINKGTGRIIQFTLTNKHVSYAPEIVIELITKRDWHRFHEIDDQVVIHLESVLPPIEDTF